MRHLSNKEITLVYDGRTSEGKKALAYAYTLSGTINKQDINNVKLSSTFIKTVVSKLEVQPKDLMNRAHPYYQKNLRGRDLDTESWLKVIKNNTYLLRAPIAIQGTKAVICDPVTKIYALSTE